jgi:hypothetical protein
VEVLVRGHPVVEGVIRDEEWNVVLHSLRRVGIA